MIFTYHNLKCIIVMIVGLWVMPAMSEEIIKNHLKVIQEYNEIEDKLKIQTAEYVQYGKNIMESRYSEELYQRIIYNCTDIVRMIPIMQEYKTKGELVNYEDQMRKVEMWLADIIKFDNIDINENSDYDDETKKIMRKMVFNKDVIKPSIDNLDYLEKIVDYIREEFKKTISKYYEPRIQNTNTDIYVHQSNEDIVKEYHEDMADMIGLLEKYRNAIMGIINIGNIYRNSEVERSNFDGVCTLIKEDAKIPCKKCIPQKKRNEIIDKISSYICGESEKIKSDLYTNYNMKRKILGHLLQDNKIILRNISGSKKKIEKKNIDDIVNQSENSWHAFCQIKIPLTGERGIFTRAMFALKSEEDYKSSVKT